MRQDLREGRLVTLAYVLCAGDQRHRAVGLEPDIDVLVRRATRGLDVIGEAQAAQQAVRLALAPPFGEARRIGARRVAT